MQNNLSPIILFVYNRPEHTLKTLQALEKNDLASESNIFIYVDGLKLNSSNDDKLKNEQVFEVVSRAWKFNSIRIKKREKNVGLAENIIGGVTEILKEFEKIIVL